MKSRIKSTSTIKSYYTITKPGIIKGNILTAVGGFLFACKWQIEWPLFIATVSGIVLVIASACVFNNYLDRNIDSKMSRTKKRALVAGTISNRSAIIYASALGLIGFSALALFTPVLIVYLGVIAFVDYVILYGFSKRRSVHSTLVGSVSGAASLVAGYCAITNQFDKAALLLFVIMVCWQMAHFYAIGLYRQDDYAKAGLPIHPIKKGVLSTKVWVLIYIFLYILSIVALSYSGYVGFVFLEVMVMLGVIWLWLGSIYFTKLTSIAWGKKMFLFSLTVITCLPIMLAVSPFLP